MRILTPCPSPRGTNIERLYITRERDKMAQDAALPPPDAPDDGGADAYEELATTLQLNLSPDLVAEAQALLQRFVDKSGNNDLGSDEPEERRFEPNPLPNPARMSTDERLAIGANIRAGRKRAEHLSSPWRIELGGGCRFAIAQAQGAVAA